MEQGGFNFWQDHSIQFLDMAFRMDKRETLEKPDGYGKQVRECGDTVEIFLTVRNGRIEFAAFETNGCLYSIACANAAVHLSEGKTLDEVRTITGQTIITYLETLPTNEHHCAELAVQALQLAVDDARGRVSRH